MNFVQYGIAQRKTWLVGIPILTVWLFVSANLIWNSTLELEIDPSRVRADGGRAYFVPIEPPAFPFILCDDSSGALRSTAQLFENDRSLRPAHIPHQVIRDNGKGAFSHFNSGLWFSSSDGTDPRSNGYRYRLIAERQLRPEVIWSTVAISIIALWFLPAFRSLIRRPARTILIVARDPYHAVLSLIAIQRTPVKHPIWSSAGWIAIAAMGCSLVGAWLLYPTSRIELTSSLVRSDSGYAYAYTSRIHAPFPYALPSDGPVAGNRSTLQIFENGKPLGPPHALHQAIRDQGKGAFSHYADTLRFSSSDGTDPRTNGYTYIAIAEREIQTEVIGIFIILTGLVLVLTRGLSSATRSIRALTSLVYGGVTIIGAAGCLLGLLLLGTTLLGSYAGDQLPTTRLFKLLPDVDKVLHALPIGCLVIAALGATVSWLAALDLHNRVASRRAEIIVLRHARAYGLVIVLAIIVSMLSSGGWSGQIGSSEYHGYSLAGLIPHSDAATFFRSSFDIGFGEEWNWISSSRPMASAFRDLITYVGRYSYPVSLVVQAILLSIACYAAALSVAYWLGIWSAIAFFALELMMVRPFLPTTSSESLSLVWAFFSIACLAHACRTGSAQWAAVALGFVCAAQFTRMGAVLVLGAVGLWVIALPKYSAAHFARKIALVVLAIGLPAALGSLLRNAYAFQSELPYLGGVNLGGWNLGSLVCELAVRVDWPECRNLHSLQLQKARGADAANGIYSHVWELVKANPLVVVRPMVDNIVTFLSILPRALVFGYTEWRDSAIMVPWSFLAVALPGLLFHFIKRARRTELLLWCFFWLALIASSAVVFFEDGWRALYATHPLMAAFVAIAFTTPSSLPRCDIRVSVAKTLSLVSLSAILLILAPWAVHRELSPREPVVLWQKVGEATVSGGNRITGFLVLPDDQIIDRKIASLSYSGFQAVLKFARLDDRWRNSISMLPAPPFAVVWAPRIAKRQSVEVFIAPTRVLEDREVTRWHFEVTPEMNEKPLLLIVRSAEPQRDP